MVEAYSKLLDEALCTGIVVEAVPPVVEALASTTRRQRLVSAIVATERSKKGSDSVLYTRAKGSGRLTCRRSEHRFPGIPLVIRIACSCLVLEPRFGRCRMRQRRRE